MTKVSVVILNYNGEKLLRQFLPSVVTCSNEAHIVVVDNASTDKSIQTLTQEFPEVQVISLDKNYGFCGGYNKGLQQVQSDYYVLLNSDVEVTPDWLAPMTAILDSNQNIAAVQPKILSYLNKDTFEYAGAGGGFVDSFGYPFCRGRIFDHVEEDTSQYDDETEIFWGSGACLMIRSQIYHQFGGLDEDFFAHMEEIDLCWKIQRASLQIYYSGKSKVFHLGAGTLSYESPRKVFLNFRNGLALIFKHFSKTELMLKFPVRVVLDWAAALVFLLKGQSKGFLAVIKAHRDFFFKDLKKNLQKRKEIQHAYPTYPKKSVMNGLIIFHYYFLKKRQFGSIIPDRRALS